jgi:hypothetical protein
MSELRNDRMATLQQLIRSVAVLPHVYDIAVKYPQKHLEKHCEVAVQHKMKRGNSIC